MEDEKKKWKEALNFIILNHLLHDVTAMDAESGLVKFCIRSSSSFRILLLSDGVKRSILFLFVLIKLVICSSSLNFHCLIRHFHTSISDKIWIRAYDIHRQSLSLTFPISIFSDVLRFVCILYFILFYFFVLIPFRRFETSFLIATLNVGYVKRRLRETVLMERFCNQKTVRILKRGQKRSS